MQVSQLVKAKGGKPIISFEFFRAKTEKGAENLEKTLDVLCATPHDYMTVTFGAGGSTRDGSFQLIDKIKKERGRDVVAYIAGIGLSPDELISILDRFKQQGIETVFVIRGDEPKDDAGFAPHPDALSYASDLLTFIKSRYDFCLGAAGYPEGHIEAVSREKDIEYALLKEKNGADYIVAQYFYDNRFFYDYVDRCRAAGVTVPIFPGIMPIYSVKMLEILSRVCGATITDEVRTGLEAVSNEGNDGVVQFGIELATKQCRDLLKHGVPGLHFYTMNRAGSVSTVIATLEKEGLL